MNPEDFYPEVKLKAGVFHLTWSKCTLRLDVRPVGDDVASIKVAGSACEEIWPLGSIFHRLAQWAEGGWCAIDEALHDREAVVGSASPEDVSVRTEKIRGGWLLALEEAIDGDTVETEMRLKSLRSGLKVGVTIDGYPGPGTYQVMGDVLQWLYETSGTALGRLPGSRVDEVAAWAAR